MDIDRSDRYLIVGAGVSGLATARHFSALGLPFDVVERNPDTGGLWDWRVPGNGMYRSAHFISSKERTAFPGVPMPEHYPDFPHNEQVLAYLRGFAHRFRLYPHIEFEREISHMTPAEEKGWRVTVAGRGLAPEETRIYRGVVLAIGHFWDPIIPEFPGRFDGHALHAVHYKEREMFAGKRVVIVGLGNSACDIAADAVQAGAASVTLSARSGSWIVPKYVLGRPADATGGRLTGRLPRPLRQWLNGRALRLLAPNPERFGLPAPSHGFHERIPVVNSLFLYYIGHGRISPRPAIEALHGRRIRFADGREEVADILVYATGYRVSFPFLAGEHLASQADGLPGFHLHLFHPTRDDLFLVGIHEQVSGGWSMHDAQARTVARYVHTLEHDPAAGGRARQTLPTLHRQVRRMSERIFGSHVANFGILVDEQSYKKGLHRFQESLPAPERSGAQPYFPPAGIDGEQQLTRQLPES